MISMQLLQVILQNCREWFFLWLPDYAIFAVQIMLYVIFPNYKIKQIVHNFFKLTMVFAMVDYVFDVCL